MKASDHELVVDQLLTMAPRVEGIPVYERGIFWIPLRLRLVT